MSSDKLKQMIDVQEAMGMLDLCLETPGIIDAERIAIGQAQMKLTRELRAELAALEGAGPTLPS
jgi:hypothetical protein